MMLQHRAVTRIEPRGADMKLFYGWVIVGAGIVITCIGMGTMMSLGVFLQPMAESQGWSRAGISMAALLNFLSMGLGSFAWGALSDRFGTRTTVFCGGVLLGIGLIAASQSATLMEFQLLFGVIVGVSVGSFYVPMTTITARWFTRNRSLAVALVSAGLALGTATIAPLSRWIITTHDWRTAMLVLGGLAWGFVIPASLLLRRPPAVPSSALAAEAGVGGQEFTLAQVLRTPQFAAIALTHFACCAAHSGPIFHMVSYAIDCGVTSMTAATVFGVAGLSAMSGRVACGLVADRVGAKPTLVAGLMLQAVAVSLYVFTRGAASFYALSMMFGFAYGGVMPLYAILVREYFGARIMGAAFGAVAMVSTFGMAIGPWAGGWLYDVFGSYFWLYIGSFGIGLGAVAIAFSFRPPSRIPIAVPVASMA
jgi:MFS family permease